MEYPRNIENFLSHNYETVDDKIVFPIEELPEQVLVDLNVSKKFKLFDGNLSISNILDIEYELIQDFLCREEPGN